jgi:hypothetical protein
MVLFAVTRVVYNLCVHPLRNFPGPIHMRASVFPYLCKEMTGTLSGDILDLHRRYGEVVRVAPHELSFANAAAWDDIYSQKQNLGRDTRFYSVPEKHLASVDLQKGNIVRRALQPGFSERSRRVQEPTIMSYVNLLVRRLHERCGGGATPLDIVPWYDFTTFDIHGDLALGETFGCLEKSDYHPWVRDTFQLSRAGRFLRLLNYFPRLKKLLFVLVGKSARQRSREHTELPRTKLLKLMDGSKDGRSDLIGNLIKRKDDLVSVIYTIMPSSPANTFPTGTVDGGTPGQRYHPSPCWGRDHGDGALRINILPLDECGCPGKSNPGGPIYL